MEDLKMVNRLDSIVTSMNIDSKLKNLEPYCVSFSTTKQHHQPSYF